MSNTVSLGTKKKQFKSIRLAAEAAGVSYMTFYMRLRNGTGGLNWSTGKAMRKPVRKYQKKELT